MGAMQLTIEGREVPHPVPRPNRAQNPPLTEFQRAILAVIQDEGFVTSTRAGVILHKLRGSCGFGQKPHPGPDAEACCGYASSDGSDACKRLAKRGYLYRLHWLGWTSK